MDLLRLEQQRQALEANLQQLRESLKVWQRWEAEYEGLKEEVLGVSPEATPGDLAKIAQTYDGELVNEKEVRELSGLDKDAPRSAEQILGLIARRQEYVQKNIETVQRQFFEAEAKSEELAFAAATQSSGAEAALPLTEIHEELDEDGNVISSRLSQPEQSTANIIESLRKAGLQEDELEQMPQQSRPKAEDLKPAITNASPPITPTSTSGLEKRSSAGSEDLERPSIRKKSVSFSADTKAPEEKPRPQSEDGKKSVAFAEKVAVMPAAPPPDTRSVSFSPMVEEIPPQPAGPVSPEMAPHAVPAQSESRAPEAVLGSQDENAIAESEEVIIPDEESPEDAQMRREMLEYHLNEVGNVVAQMDLDEPDLDMDNEEDDEDDEDDNSSYYTTSEYLEDEDTPYTTGLSESEESEDEFGRTKGRMITPEYRKQMEELQNKLIGNLGPAPKDSDIADADAELNPNDVRRLVIRDKRNSTSSISSDNSDKKSNSSGSKKRVSFAEALDVADEEPGSPPLKAQKHQEGENVAPVTTNITERTTAASHSLPRRMSNESTRLGVKKDRAAPITLEEAAGSAIDDDLDMEDANTDTAPPGGPPAGVTIAKELTERSPGVGAATAPSTDDPIMARRELAAEYYRRRNEIIKQQGGFTAKTDDEEARGELMEERDGKVRKVSRFRAARMRP